MRSANSQKKPGTLDSRVAIRLAVEADVDPRTIQKMATGGASTNRSTARALAVLQKHGYVKGEGIDDGE